MKKIWYGVTDTTASWSLPEEFENIEDAIRYAQEQNRYSDMRGWAREAFLIVRYEVEKVCKPYRNGMNMFASSTRKETAIAIVEIDDIVTSIKA